MTKKFLITITVLIFSSLYAQDVITTNIISYTNSLIDVIPTGLSTDQYVQPEISDLDKFGEAIKLIIENKISDANSKAGEIGYKVINIIDNSGDANNEYYVIKSVSDNLWGTFIFNKNPKRKKLVIQIPHPKHDTHTGEQGILVFRNSGSFAYFLSGAKRCNSSYYTDCSGSTTACSDSYENYRQSDQAHNVISAFQKATEILENNIDSLIYIQFHGFSKGSSDPHIIMSNGTNNSPDGVDYLSLLSNELAAIDKNLTFKIAHLDISWTRLIATTNTQGRLINGSNAPCYNSALTNSGRFIHLEQSYDRLRKYESDWLKMSTAVANIFPADDVTFIEETTEYPTEISISNYPNPFNASTKIRFQVPDEAFVSVIIYDLFGRKIKTLVNERKAAGSHEVMFESGNIASGVYLYTLEAGSVKKTKKMILLK